MNAVLASIMENLREIEIVLEPTPAAFVTDRIQTSNGREFTIQQFVARYLPSSYDVQKGHISSMSGISSEIDCVVLAPNHPKLITPVRQVIIAEGVHAAIELKPDITVLSDAANTEIKRALNQIKSVKRLERSIRRIVLPALGQKALNPYFNKIPSFIFAFRSRPVIDMINFIIKQRSVGTYEYEDFPDFIITLDHGITAYSPHAKESIFKDLLTASFPTVPDHVFINFPLDRVSTLALFITILYSVSPPEILISDFILRKYLDLTQGVYFTAYTINVSTNEIVPMEPNASAVASTNL